MRLRTLSPAASPDNFFMTWLLGTLLEPRGIRFDDGQPSACEIRYSLWQHCDELGCRWQVCLEAVDLVAVRALAK